MSGAPVPPSSALPGTVAVLGLGVQGVALAHLLLGQVQALLLRAGGADRAAVPEHLHLLAPTGGPDQVACHQSPISRRVRVTRTRKNRRRRSRCSVRAFSRSSTL